MLRAWYERGAKVYLWHHLSLLAVFGAMLFLLFSPPLRNAHSSSGNRCIIEWSIFLLFFTLTYEFLLLLQLTMLSGITTEARMRDILMGAARSVKKIEPRLFIHSREALHLKQQMGDTVLKARDANDISAWPTTSSRHLPNSRN